MGELTEEQKLLECLFGHHDFFTSGCVRQCRRCRIVQVYAGPSGWGTAKLEMGEDFDLEEMDKLQKLTRTNDVWRERQRRNTLWTDACDYFGQKWEKKC